MRLTPTAVRRRGLIWAAASTTATVVLGGTAAALTTATWTGALAPAGPVWSSWGWWVAAVVYAVALSVGLSGRDASARRFLLTATTAAVFYLTAGSLLTTLDAIGTEDPDVAGSGWAAAAEGTAVYAVLIYGNGAIAFAAPLLIGLIRPLRPATVGQPPRWTTPRYSAADDDVAAEDFDIY